MCVCVCVCVYMCVCVYGCYVCPCAGVCVRISNCCCCYQLDVSLGADGAAALAPALKALKGLTELNLGCKCVIGRRSETNLQ